MIRVSQRGLELTVALLIVLLAVAVLFTAYSYSRSSGLFPVFVGWIFLGLTLLELVLQITAMRHGAVPGVAEPASAAAGEGSTREFGGFLWLGLLLLVLFVAGFLVATPVFLFTFLRFAARRSVSSSVSLALGATVFVYLVFEWLLKYQLYRGVLFGG